MNDLIDRRPRRFDSDEDLDDDDARDPGELRDGVYQALGFDTAGGSPEMSDHLASRVLIEAAVARLAALIEPAHSRRTIRYATADGEVRRVEEPTTRSSRYGVQRKPERNLRAYFLAEIEGLGIAEIARRLGQSQREARRAKAAGAKLVQAFARTKLDPRRPSEGGRPLGKNERPW